MTPASGRPYRGSLVTLVVPAKDEAEGIARCLRSLPRATLATMGFASEVLVLDGNSADATAAIARSLGATVVTDREPGKGAALRHAREAFRGDYVVMLDADGTYPADAIPTLLDPLMRGDADVAMGLRRPLGRAMPGPNRFGNAVLSLMASLLYRRPCRDVCTGLWAFRADVVRHLPLQSRGFGLEAELFALTARLRLRVAQRDVDYLSRNGKAKLRPGRDGARIFRRLWRSRFVPLPRTARPPSPEGSSSRAWAPEAEA